MFGRKEYEYSAREFSDERAVVFGRKEYGSSAREFSDERSVFLGHQEYFTRSEFCEKFSGYFSFGRHEQCCK